MSEAEDCQAPICSLCARMVLARLAIISGLFATLRPSVKFFRVARFPHFEQNFLSLGIAAPQLHLCWGFGRVIDGTLLPLTSLRRDCVRRVAISCRASLDVGLEIEDQS